MRLTVGRLADRLRSADEADADAVVVVALDVSTGFVLVASVLKDTVTSDDEVIADAEPPILQMPLVDLFRSDVLVGVSGSAVDDDEVGLHTLLDHHCWNSSCAEPTMRRPAASG